MVDFVVMEGEGTHRTLIDIPDNSLIQEVVEAVGYIDVDGEYKFAARYQFERANSAIGLLQRVQHEIMKDADDA